MTVVADTSVLVAAFSSWHESHPAASRALGRLDAVVAHCLLETYSVLTRLPAPHRMAPDIVSTYLQATYGRRRVLGLSPDEQRKLVTTCVAQGLAGGAVYDAMIGATCVRARATLLTLDVRARQTYLALGVDHELLA